MTNDSFIKFIEHTQAMKKLTNSEIINNYWLHAQSLSETKRIGFIIQGNLQWHSDEANGIDFDTVARLKSYYHDPIGKHIAVEQVRNYLQMYFNMYEMRGTLPIEIDANNPVNSMPIIENAVKSIILLCNSISTLFGSSLVWSPAIYAKVKVRPMPPPPEDTTESHDEWVCVPFKQKQEESSSTIIKDNHVLSMIIPFFSNLNTLPENVKTPIATSIDWHSQGNKHTSGLSRFVHYWESIELLGTYFYQNLSKGLVSRKSKHEKRSEILKLIHDGVTESNCTSVVADCNEIRQPTAKTKIVAVFKNIFEEENVIEDLFNPDDISNRSLYQIRNDIAHGNISEKDFADKSMCHRRLNDAHNISRKYILAAVSKASWLSNNLSK